MILAGKTFSEFSGSVLPEIMRAAAQKTVDAVGHHGYFSLERMMQTLGKYLGEEEGTEFCSEERFHELWLTDTDYTSQEALERLIEIEYFKQV